jgi:phosphocarrier protein
MNEWPEEAGAARVASPETGEAAPPGQAAAAASGEATLRRSVRIVNSRGLHARAAAKLVALAERFGACLNVSLAGDRGGESVPACSIMGLMMLGAGKGTEIVIEAEGWDARAALDAVAGLVEAGFNED